MDNSLKILEETKIELDALNKECIDIQENIIRIINKLKQIALNKDILFSEENIELLIQNEEDKKLEGFLQRVDALKILKKKLILMKNVQKFLDFFFGAFISNNCFLFRCSRFQIIFKFCFLLIRNFKFIYFVIF